MLDRDILRELPCPMSLDMFHRHIDMISDNNNNLPRLVNPLSSSLSLQRTEYDILVAVAVISMTLQIIHSEDIRWSVQARFVSLCGVWGPLALAEARQVFPHEEEKEETRLLPSTAQCCVNSLPRCWGKAHVVVCVCVCGLKLLLVIIFSLFFYAITDRVNANNHSRALCDGSPLGSTKRVLLYARSVWPRRPGSRW